MGTFGFKALTLVLLVVSVRAQHRSETDYSYMYQYEQETQYPAEVGIPGVISGPQASYSNGDYENKQRYDINPLDDVLPEFPDVENEFDSSMILTLPPIQGEFDLSNLDLSGPDNKASTEDSSDYGYSNSSSYYKNNKTGSDSSLTSDCTQIGGCSEGSVQSLSRRSDIRTSKRYIKGQLKNITYYESLYENGKLVHENVTEQGVDELTPQELQKYGINQLNLVNGSYQPESNSQRHEVRQEKKYVNGRQTYDLYHERRFEDGQLIYDNRTEKDEDDFRVSGLDVGQLGAGNSSNQYDGAGRHDTSDSRPGSVGQSFQTHQVSGKSGGMMKPIYTTRRPETPRPQEFTNGQPVDDPHSKRNSPVADAEAFQPFRPSVSSSGAPLVRALFGGRLRGGCNPNPCRSGGTCISGTNGPFCICASGYKGTRCHKVYCPRRLCSRGGICSIVDGKPECSCKRDYSGLRCQNRMRRHASRP